MTTGPNQTRSSLTDREIVIVLSGPDLDLWGPLGRLSCGGPQYMIFMEAIKLSSEASEPLGMRGPEKRPLELQLFFVSFWVSLFKQS